MEINGSRLLRRVFFLAIAFVFIMISLYSMLCPKELKQRYGNSVLQIFGKEKPILVIGFLSQENYRFRRDVLRNTLIKSFQGDIPFQVRYKFLLDHTTIETIAENGKYGDMIFLNSSVTGYAKMYSEKLYKWFKFAFENNPRAELIIKSDDDVSLCTPQIFEHLYKIRNKTLYYGLSNKGLGLPVGYHVRHDEMFVVLGHELVRRLLKRKLCHFTDRKCDPVKDLYASNAGGSSLGRWLSMYDDVNMQNGKEYFIHGGRMLPIFIRKADISKRDFCENNFLFHRSSPFKTYKLNHFNEYLRSGGKITTFENVTISGVPGKYFRPVPKVLDIPDYLHLSLIENKEKHCDKWAVTITKSDKPSSPIVTVISRKDWCVVVLGTAENIHINEQKYINGIKDLDNNKFRYLSIPEQDKLYPVLSNFSPYRHKGRKIIGFMYAIQRGAKYIWDFDDSDMLSTREIVFSSQYVFQFLSNCNKPFNGKINSHLVYNSSELCSYHQHKIEIGLYLSIEKKSDLTNISKDKNANSLIVLPEDSYIQINSSTVWTINAFKYLFLPLSVDEKLSVILRGYIAQYFLNRNGLRLAYSLMTSSKLSDAKKETIVKNSQTLVDILIKMKSENNDMETIYFDLYRRGFVEYEDLALVRIWVKTLSASKSSSTHRMF